VVPVAFAGCALELIEVDDRDQTPALDDHLSALKLSCGLGDPCAAHAEHRRQKLMGQRHLIGLKTVMHHQKQRALRSLSERN